MPELNTSASAIRSRPRHVIRAVGTEAAEQAFAILALAFDADPIVRHWLPDPLRFLTYFPQIARCFGGRGLEHRWAHVADGSSGAALWLPPGVEPDQEGMNAIFVHAVPEEKQAALAAFGDEMAALHPREPHYYLPLMGVDPRHQREGIGSALLRYALERCDREGVPAYLEATSPENFRLYARHGFEHCGTVQVGDSPPLFAMRRRANGG